MAATLSWRLLPDVGRWQEEYAEKLTIALVSRGEPEEHAISVSDCSIFNLVGRY
jgi:hypothetical protein